MQVEALTSGMSLLGAYIEVAPPKWLVIVLVVAFIVIASGWNKRQRRQWEGRFEVRVCPRCGGNGPPHGMFCGKCGARMMN